MRRWAEISDCGHYRHLLGRQWGEPTFFNFIMLNPSTADATQDDPTVRKCIGFAKRSGVGGILVTNLFDYRATNPLDIRRAERPCSLENDTYIIKALSQYKSTLVLAWGAHGAYYKDRVDGVLHTLRQRRSKAYHLGLTQDGHPKHPLMLSYNEKLRVVDLGSWE